ncbi:MAG: hypothetical protein FJ387_20465 [Verrucomicrobia bacterium]|nr:hypothetical protein [Verrucomicrobiota bacterium]
MDTGSESFGGGLQWAATNDSSAEELEAGSLSAAIRHEPVAAPSRPATLTFLCNSEGFICEVICNDLGQPPGLIPGTEFTQLIHPRDRLKAERFLTALRRYYAAFDWAMSLALGARLEPLHFAGVATRGILQMVAAQSRVELLCGLKLELNRRKGGGRERRVESSLPPLMPTPPPQAPSSLQPRRTP